MISEIEIKEILDKSGFSNHEINAEYELIKILYDGSYHLHKYPKTKDELTNLIHYLQDYRREFLEEELELH